MAGVAFAAGAFIIGLFSMGGGVMFVPALLLLPGVTVPTAVSTVFVACIPMTALRLAQLHFVYKRVKWKAAAPMMSAAAVAAVAGQASLKHVPQAIVIIMVGFAAAWTGAKVLLDMRKAARAKRLKEAQEAMAAAMSEPAESVSTIMDIDELAAKADAHPDGLAGVAGAPTTEEVVAKLSEHDETSKAKAEAATAAPPAAAAPPAVAEAAKGKADVATTPPPLGRSIACGLIAGYISSVAGLGGPIVVFPLMFRFMPQLNMHMMAGMAAPTALCIVSPQAP